MQTSDWAAEAYLWYENYHTAIANHFETNEECAAVESDFYQNFFEGLIVTDEIVEKFQNHSILKHIDLLDWKASDYEILEQERGWKPLLRRLPHVTNNRLLSLIQRNLLLPIQGNEKSHSNQALVSRQQWALIEGLRWKLGLYNHPDVVKVFHDAKRSNGENEESSECCDGLKVMSSIENSTVGRYVIYVGSDDLEPGDVIWEAKPYVIAPYDLDASSMLICFHCGSRTDRNPVRELTLQCPTCKVWSYCSASCRDKHSTLHENECNKISKLLDKCQELDIPIFKGLLVYRAALRIVMSSKRIERDCIQDSKMREHCDVLKLECHINEHIQQSPEYTKRVELISCWMMENCFEENASQLQIIDQEVLRNLYFAININSIGLGSGAAGLFAGMPSMFNHSCNENVTHSWEHDDGHGSSGMILRFRAVQTIKKGDECCISYVSNLEDTSEQRTESLQLYKFFTCECPRCSSSTEEGRLEAIHDWKHCVKTLQQDQTNDVVAVYRNLVELSDTIFPEHFVTKGWALEECAHSLLQDSRLKNEAYNMLMAARKQYVICRGENSELVQRIDVALQDLHQQSTSPLNPTVGDDENDSNDNALEKNDGADLILSIGWCTVLFEIKTYEADDDYKTMSNNIKLSFNDSNIIHWSDSFRLCDIGFGIRSLVMACELNESVVKREDFADRICGAYDEVIQHIDFITVNDYQ